MNTEPAYASHMTKNDAGKDFFELGNSHDHAGPSDTTNRFTEKFTCIEAVCELKEWLADGVGSTKMLHTWKGEKGVEGVRTNEWTCGKVDQDSKLWVKEPATKDRIPCQIHCQVSHRLAGAWA